MQTTSSSNWIQSFLVTITEFCHRNSLISSPIFDADLIIEEAQKQTGLVDLGGEEYVLQFRHHMKLWKCKDQMPLLSQLIGWNRLLDKTILRLKMEEYIHQNPQVEHIVIERPIIIVGLPRTGTTALQNIIAKHPNHRAFQFWELDSPVPTSNNRMIDQWKRRSNAHISTMLLNLFAPELMKIKHTTANSYEECHNLFTIIHSRFYDQLFYGYSKSAQDDLFNDTDMTWAYREYKRMLQMILHQQPKTTTTQRLVLKCPEHAFFLDPLLKVFPDACVIWCHRDPVPTLASYSAMVTVFRKLTFGEVKLKSIGPDVVSFLHSTLMRAVEERKQKNHLNANIMDVHFHDIVHNKVELLKNIEKRFQFDPWQGWEESVEKFAKEKRKDKYGAVTHIPKVYGLEPDDHIWKDFAEYMQMFHVKKNEKKENTL